MCIFIATHIGDCCKQLGRSLAACCRAINPIALLLSLVTSPVALVIILGWGLGAAIYKWPTGAYYQEVEMWKHYCGVLKKGKDAYTGTSRRKNACDECCDSCLAEVYCCGAPIFIMLAVFWPVLLLGWLLLTVVFFSFQGLCAGAIRKDLKFELWWPGVRRVVVGLDRETSTICYDTATRLLCDDDGTQRQHDLEQPAAPRVPHQVQPSYGGPQPQVMMPMTNPAVPVMQGQPAYVPQAPAYVPAAPLANPGYAVPVAQPTYGAPQATPVAHAVRAPGPGPSQPQQAPVASALGGVAGALGKAAFSAASAAVTAVEREAQRQREVQAAGQRR